MKNRSEEDQNGRRPVRGPWQERSRQEAKVTLDQGGGGRDREAGGCERYSGRERGREGGLRGHTKVVDPSQQRKAEGARYPQHSPRLQKAHRLQPDNLT